MKLLCRVARASARLIVGGALLVGLAGCTAPRVDWSTRVGTYTYDQAVTDYGPPDKEAVLSDGSKVTEWLTRRGWNGGFVSVYGYPYAHPRYRGQLGATTYYEPGAPDYWLRLKFDAEGKLLEWRKVVR